MEPHEMKKFLFNKELSEGNGNYKVRKISLPIKYLIG